MHNSEIYAVKWQSSTLAKFLMFMGKAIADIAKANKTLGIEWYLNMAITIYNTFKDNPFSKAYANATSAGKSIAE